jgi:phenylacetate-CoA ligase
MIYDPKMDASSRDALFDLQSRRLAETVRRVYDNVPLYRKRMDEKGIRPEDIRTRDDLRASSFFEKTDLRDCFPYGLLAAPLMRKIVRIQGSSGTTGKPIVPAIRP